MADNWHKVTKELEEEICSMYKEGKTIEMIRLVHHVNDNRIRDILVKNGVEIRNPRKSNHKEGEWDFQTETQKKFPKHEGMHYVARSKIDRVEYDDYLNISGVLTRYAKNKLGVNAPTLYERRKLMKNEGRLWYEDYFDIVEVPDQSVEYKKCPYCDWKTTSLNNRSGSFVMHLKYEHDMSREEYLKEHPEDKELFSYANKTIQLQYETDTSKFITCPICGKKLRRIDWRHLNKHGISYEEFMKAYTGSTVSDETHAILRNKTIEQNKTMKFQNRSKAELEIEQWIRSHGIAVNEKRKMIEGHEVDIYMPEIKMGIEYDGMLYHTEEYGKGKKYHLEKTEVCERNGIGLIHVFEDEYKNKKQVVLSKIGRKTGCDSKLPRIGARKCVVREISSDEAIEFMSIHSINGPSNSTIHIGGFYDGRLIAVMSFREEKDESWEMTGFATNIILICQGMGGKLFKYFTRNYKPQMVVSYADRRWTVNYDNNLYTKIGFVIGRTIPPSYKYVGKGPKTYYRLNSYASKKESLMGMDRKGVLSPNMSEEEMRLKLGLKKIWDCGLIEYIWKPTNQ